MSVYAQHFFLRGVIWTHVESFQAPQVAALGDFTRAPRIRDALLGLCPSVTRLPRQGCEHATGIDPRVAALVYVTAFAPDADETTQSLQEKFPATDIFSHVEVADGRV